LNCTVFSRHSVESDGSAVSTTFSHFTSVFLSQLSSGAHLCTIFTLKNVGKIKKSKNVKNVTRIKKLKKRFSHFMVSIVSWNFWTLFAGYYFL